MMQWTQSGEKIDLFDALVKPIKVANVKIGFLVEKEMHQSFFLEFDSSALRLFVLKFQPF